MLEEPIWSSENFYYMEELFASDSLELESDTEEDNYLFDRVDITSDFGLLEDFFLNKERLNNSYMQGCEINSQFSGICCICLVTIFLGDNRASANRVIWQCLLSPVVTVPS